MTRHQGGGRYSACGFQKLSALQSITSLRQGAHLSLCVISMDGCRWIIHFNRHNLIRADSKTDLPILDRQRGAIGILHQIRLQCIGKTGRNGNAHLSSLAATPIYMEDQRVAVLGFLDSSQRNMIRLDRDERLARRHQATMRLYLRRGQRAVELVSAANRERLLPSTGVWIERVRELLAALVCIRIGIRGCAQQREAQQISHRIVAVL